MSKYPYPENRREKNRVRMKTRVEKLNENFNHYLEVLKANNPFNTTQISNHQKTIKLRRKIGSVEICLKNEEYLTSLYNTVKSWYEMRGAHLIEDKDFKQALKNNSSTLMTICDKKLLDLKREEVGELSNILVQLIDDLSVSDTNTQLVAGSKTLHHILPELVPPIDRNYTIRFLYCGFKKNETPPIYSTEQLSEILPILHYIGEVNREKIRKTLSEDNYRYPMFSGETKMIDNTIVSYILEHWKMHCCSAS